MRRSAPALLGLTLLVSAAAFAGAAVASTPGSSALTVPRTGSVQAAWSGSVSAGVGLDGCSAQVGSADHHTLTLSVPAGLYDSSEAKLTVTIDAKADNDLDLLITDPSGTAVASGATSGGDETAVVANPGPGDYDVTVCDSSVAPDDYTAEAVIESAAKAKAGAAPAGAAKNVIADQQLTFTPATVVDPVLFGGEPGINVDPADPKRYFVDWPIGANQTGVLYRSNDGGVSFQKRYAAATDLATAGAACQGRQVPICPAGGGGDTDVHLNPTTGSMYFSSQVSLANEAIGTSLDHGTTFPASMVDTAIAKTHSGVDRQWVSSFKGSKDVYLSYHVPLVGQYVHHSADDGALGSWDEPGVPQIVGVTQSGSQVADNGPGLHGDQADGKNGKRRALYIGYLGTTLVPGGVGGFNVGVSTDGAKTFVSHQVPGSENARNFTVLNLDKQGNLYATWTDSVDQITYLSTSKADAGTNVTAPGSQWSSRVPVSGGTLNVTIFPNVTAGDPGRAAVGFYGTSADATTPDAVQTGQGGWFPYVSTSTDALCQWDAKPCAAPTFHQSRIAERPNQDDNICTAGTTCLATMGNRNLADYFDVTLDDHGYLGFVWSDGNNATKQPYVKVARQIGGPSLFAAQPAARGAVRANGAPDPTGDAIYPFAGALVDTAPNHPTLDLTGTTVALKDASTLRVRMRLAQATGLGAGVPSTDPTADGTSLVDQARYVTRFELGGNAYYVEATVPAGGEPSFGAGTVDDAQIISNPGATRNGYANSYVPQTDATGSVEAGALVIDVPVADLGGVKAGSRLVSVGSYTILSSALADTTKQLLMLPLVVDSTPTFSTTLTAAAAVPPTGTAAPVAAPGAAAPGTTGPLAATGLPLGLAAAGLLLLVGAGLARRRSA